MRWTHFLTGGAVYCSSISTLFAAMQFFPGDAQEIGPDETNTATLMTWNIYGLPNKLVAIRPWEDRIDGIANTILQEKGDIVVLEECFERGLSLGLYERLKKEYAHIYLDLEAEDTLRPSGLALFSKFPVKNLRFTPHLDLLDYSRNTNMGTIDFVITDVDAQPFAHIIASHFLGSSNFQWRTGKINDGRRLSYEQIRQEEAFTTLQNNSESSIPQYLCGDLNVDRRSVEFASSHLNAEINPRIREAMSFSMQQSATNTNFWKFHQGFQEAYPSLSAEEALGLAQHYEKIYLESLKDHLKQAPWDRSLSEFHESLFSSLKPVFHHKPQKLWEYFKNAAIQAIAKEQEFWEKNNNEGPFPHVPIGRVFEVSALPIEEAIDFILGTNSNAEIIDIAIGSGYDHKSIENTLSDHHPVKAIIRLSLPKTGA
jgi:hypothetical protein